MNGVPYTPGSTISMPLPVCAAGPLHCDARELVLVVVVCIEVGDCFTYTLVVSVPLAPAPADDASLRAINLTAGRACTLPDWFQLTPTERLEVASLECHRILFKALYYGALSLEPVERIVLSYQPAFYYTQTTYRVTMDGDEEYIYVSVAPNNPKYSALFINGNPALPYVAVAVPLPVLIDELGGIITVKIIGRGFHTSTSQLNISRLCH